MKSAVVTPLDVKLMNLAMLALVVVFAVLCVVTAVRSFSRMSVFDIRGIEVNGDTRHNNSVTLRANVAPHIAGTFLTVDLARVRSAFESAPWVRRAVVHRDFPNRLRVTLQEHMPVALWGGEGDARLLTTLVKCLRPIWAKSIKTACPRSQVPRVRAAMCWPCTAPLSRASMRWT